jgi:hypothetical protein
LDRIHAHTHIADFTNLRYIVVRFPNLLPKSGAYFYHLKKSNIVCYQVVHKKNVVHKQKLCIENKSLDDIDPIISEFASRDVRQFF